MVLIFSIEISKSITGRGILYVTKVPRLRIKSNGWEEQVFDWDPKPLFKM
jgi:hypothetical protein